MRKTNKFYVKSQYPQLLSFREFMERMNVECPAFFHYYKTHGLEGTYHYTNANRVRNVVRRYLGDDYILRHDAELRIGFDDLYKYIIDNKDFIESDVLIREL